MPNLCFNLMTVEGPAEYVRAFFDTEGEVKDGRRVLAVEWAAREGGDMELPQPTKLVATFVTAGEPPAEQFLDSISSGYPPLKITIQYDCSESDLAGLLVWRCGSKIFRYSDDYVTDYADPDEIEEELESEYDDPTELAEAVAEKRAVWETLQAVKRAAAAL